MVVNGVFAKLVPMLTVLVLILISVTPLGLGEIVAFALPMLPFAAIQYWMLSEGRSIPVVVVFLAGIIIDVLTYGPLGYWALLYLAGVAATSGMALVVRPVRWLTHWAMFVAVNAAICLFAWALATVYFGRIIDPWPMMVTTIALGVTYPILAFSLAGIDRWTTPPRQLNLERRV